MLCTREIIAEAVSSNEAIYGLLSLFARCVIGNGLGAHPSADGHKLIASSVIEAYEHGYTALDETVKNAIKYAELLANYVSENYEEIYADAHTALRNNGTIAELNAALDAAMDELAAARAELEGRELIDSLAETKELLIKELTLTEATLAEIKNLVNYETITEAQADSIKTLALVAEEHLVNIYNLAAEVGGVALDQVIVAAELTAE